MSARKWPVFVAAVGVAALALVGTATSASALERVDCKETGYLQVGKNDTSDSRNGSAMCFKNKGDQDVDIHNVLFVSSGNNAGWFDYRDKDGKSHRYDFSKWDLKTFDPKINITYLHVN